MPSTMPRRAARAAGEGQGVRRGCLQDADQGHAVEGFPTDEATVPASAQILHKNTQILSALHKRTANRHGMVGSWGKSSLFNFGDRGCHGRCCTMAGGWSRHRSALALSPS
jgi:hypothetical protein